MIEDWCQQYPSHSTGSVAFGQDGKLYASGGDGASFNWVDYGQGGTSINQCVDPANEGGALRSQDMRTTSDPVTLDGTVIRVDPETGAGSDGNPFAGSTDANARRIVAYGLRNPFRATFRPDTNELWAGDVGWNEWEEINRLTNAADATAENFGWPCYEGSARQPGYDNQNLPICETLYGANAVTPPYYAYRHSDQVIPSESCPIGGSSIAGLSFAFYTGGPYPAEYDGALFFADYTRRCIWAWQRAERCFRARRTSRDSSAAPRTPSTCRSDPTGTCTTPTSAAGRFAGSTTRPVRISRLSPWQRPRRRPAASA
jgi:glucose/arabinose dehydrogenase